VCETDCSDGKNSTLKIGTKKEQKRFCSHPFSKELLHLLEPFFTPTNCHVYSGNCLSLSLGSRFVIDVDGRKVCSVGRVRY